MDDRAEVLADGGGGGIRTHGASRLAGFQDQSFRPLSHPTMSGHRPAAGTAQKRPRRWASIPPGLNGMKSVRILPAVSAKGSDIR